MSVSMAEDARTLRLFVAINLPPPIRGRLAAVQDELAARGLSFRWARPEGIHLTLAFLGETEASWRPAIEEAVAGAAARYRPFELGARGLGCFPSGARARPRVVWAGLHGDLEALARLQGDVALALRQTGVALDDRPFQPHVTLGRARVPLDGEQARPLWPLLAGAQPPFGGWLVQTADLMQSTLGRGGSIYTVLRAAPLGETQAPSADVSPPDAGAGLRELPA
jgi:2'-5' RNA ligase